MLNTHMIDEPFAITNRFFNLKLFNNFVKSPSISDILFSSQNQNWDSLELLRVHQHLESFTCVLNHIFIVLRGVDDKDDSFGVFVIVLPVFADLFLASEYPEINNEIGF